MLYFYLWVLFLLSISLALPIVAYVEKSRARKAAGERAAATADEGGEAAGFDEAAVEEVAAEEGLDEFGAAMPAGADDFSAFDDFK
ncbi:MAG: hypothetical protein ACO1RT_21190 [Planctomycetaceae bacterium]